MVTTKRTGMKIGEYAVLGTIGQGGMGTVVRAQAPEGGEVALKLLLDPRPDRVRRFQRERRLLTKLGKGEGFVPILGWGESELGPYLVMPYLTGGSLKTRLEKGKLKVDESIELARRLGEAMGRAHARRVIHRDLKPDNILFADDGTALIADLGLAKHFRKGILGGASQTRVSSTGEARGTIGYMAPEQIRDSKSVGPAADVFALGAILYECLTGEIAFGESNHVQVLGSIAGAELPALDRPDIPEWAREVIRASVSFEARDRPRDGRAFAQALARGDQVPKPPSPWRRRRFAVYTGILVGLAAVVFAGGWIAAHWPEELLIPIPDDESSESEQK